MTVDPRHGQAWRVRWDWFVSQILSGAMLWLEPDGTLHNNFPQWRGGAILSQHGAELARITRGMLRGVPERDEQTFLDLVDNTSSPSAA